MIASETVLNTLIAMPGYIFISFINAYVRYLLGQREVKFYPFATLISFVLHIPIAYYLAVSLDLQLIGISISLSIHFLLRLIILFTFIRFSRFYPNLVPIFHLESFRNLWPQLKLSFSSSLMQLMGWWANDCFTLMSTFMGIEVMAAQTVCRNVSFMFQSLPMGIMMAASVTVGNYIGM